MYKKERAELGPITEPQPSTRPPQYSALSTIAMLARFYALLAFTTAALTVSASPFVMRDSPVTLPIARRVKETGIYNILAHDQARAKALISRAQGQGKKRDVYNVNVTNQAVTYIASVGIGCPPTYYDLLVDTGSSTTWVGAGPAYVQTNSSQDTGETVVRAPLLCYHDHFLM